MMYRPNQNVASDPPRRLSLQRGKRSVFWALILLCFTGTAVIMGFSKIGDAREAMVQRDVNAESDAASVMDYVEDRYEVGEFTHNFYVWNYAEEFCDLNDVQLQAAAAVGIPNPGMVAEPDKYHLLQRISSGPLYMVDSMQHSSPHLTHEALRLLDCIGSSFQQVMEQHPSLFPERVRPVVTSAFRTEQQVHRLRRRNRNAAEQSCHCYGTTFDLSYLRFQGEDSVVGASIYMKNALAMVLYELRRAGLCYVKYERRQACFHITLRPNSAMGRTGRYESVNVPVRDDGMRDVAEPTKYSSEPSPAPVMRVEAKRGNNLADHSFIQY